jgi:hypothetical protein
MRLMMNDDPGHVEGEAGMGRRSNRAMLRDLNLVQALLKAFGTREIKAAEQLHGLTVTMRPYQPQTLSFMQRAEREATSFRRKLW